MIKSAIKATTIFIVLASLFVHCKSQEHQVVLANALTQATNMIVIKKIVEHQYEGIDSAGFTRIELAGDIISVPQWAFAIVPTLEEVKLAPNIKLLDDNAFFSCKKLSKINLSNR